MENYFIIIDSSLNLFITLKSECFATMNYCYLLGTFLMKNHSQCLPSLSCLTYLFFLWSIQSPICY